MSYPRIFVAKQETYNTWRATIYLEDTIIYRDFEDQADAYAWVGKKLREHEA